MTYTTIGYFLLIFFVSTLLLVGDLVFFASGWSEFCLLNSVIIFSASLTLIFLDSRLIFRFNQAYDFFFVDRPL